MALVVLTFMLVLAPSLTPVVPPPQYLHGAGPMLLSDPRSPAAYQLLLEGCENGTCTVNASTIAAFSAMGGTGSGSSSSISSASSQGGSEGGQAHRDAKPQSRGLFSWMVRSPVPPVAPERAPQEKPRRDSVAAEDLDAIDLEGGIEALLFLLEAAKKTKQKQQQVDAAAEAVDEL